MKLLLRLLKPAIILGLAACATTLHIASCGKEDVKKNEFAFKVPKDWPAPVYAFEGNEVSEAKFNLGKELFYDVQLSLTNTVSCGSCHQPFAAFAHLDHDVSHGVYDRLGKRNSPPLFNLNWHSSFFWDGRSNHLEVQPLSPITDSTEMAETLPNVLAKLQSDQRYPPLFTAAFGDALIDSQRMLKALAVFMGMMVSDNAKYDKYMRGEEQLTEQESRGMAVYTQHCSGCHKAPLFSDFNFRSNGLAPRLTTAGTEDSGRAAVAPFQAENMYKFKVPSLRNLRFTRPYMHDGRFQTLEQVLDHYSQIDANAVNLDPQLVNGIQLSQQERSDLLAFLNTLNDEEFVRDRRFVK